MTTINLDEVMARRFQLVEDVAIIAGKHKQELAPLNEEITLCEGFIREEMLKGGLQQVKTPVGMAYFTTKSSCSVTDWDALLAYIRANEAWQLLNHAVNKSSAKEIIDATKSNVPGAEYQEFKDLAWRRNTKT